MSAPSNQVQEVDAIDGILEMSAHLKGYSAYLAGSVVAAHHYGMPRAWSDIDIFCPTMNTLVANGQKLIDLGFNLDDRMERTWARWLRYGIKSWHTNSLRLESPSGLEVNLIYKTTEGHAATSLAEVIESFDFGLLCRGYDLNDGAYRDMQSYLFPDYPYNAALPMMPNKRENWRHGYISQYNGMREFGRYAKYHGYGYDMTAVKDDLAEGYFQASLYYEDHFKPEMQKLGQIYQSIATHIQLDEIDHLFKAAREIDYQDSFDSIMASLE